MWVRRVVDMAPWLQKLPDSGMDPKMRRKAAASRRGEIESSCVCAYINSRGGSVPRKIFAKFDVAGYRWVISARLRKKNSEEETSSVFVVENLDVASWMYERSTGRNAVAALAAWWQRLGCVVTAKKMSKPIFQEAF